jgi:hypothetical protein
VDILPDRDSTSIVDDDDHEPTEADRQYWASQNQDWHELDGPHDDDQADDIDQWAGESAYLDSHELGLKTY